MDISFDLLWNLSYLRHILWKRKKIRKITKIRSKRCFKGTQISQCICLQMIEYRYMYKAKKAEGNDAWKVPRIRSWGHEESCRAVGCSICATADRANVPYTSLSDCLTDWWHDFRQRRRAEVHSFRRRRSTESTCTVRRCERLVDQGRASRSLKMKRHPEAWRATQTGAEWQTE